MRSVPRRGLLIVVATFILISLACNISQPFAPTPTPSPTPIPLPPTIVETIPPVGTEIPLGSLLTIYFSEPMDRASVEAALSVSTAVPLVFSWVDDAILTLAPSQPFPADAEVGFTLAESAKSQSGLSPLEPIALTYSTPGLLRVAQVLPASQADSVSPDSAVVVAFNQPVVALGADQASLPAGLTLEPAASGKGEWLNTSTYIFHPEPALAGGTQFTARVNPALTSTGGTPLDPNAGQNAWTFRTSLPNVLSVSHDEETSLSLEPSFEITFNQPMERASVEANLTFKGPDGGNIPGAFEWNERGTVLTFKPSGRLSRQTVYTLTVGGASRSFGGVTLGSDVQNEYATYGAFAFAGSNIPEGGMHEQNREVPIYFSAPLKFEQERDLSKLVSISPKPDYFSATINGSTISIYGQFKPGQKTTVTLAGALADRWGQTLGQDTTFTFLEPDARPNLTYGSYVQTFFTLPDDPVVTLQMVNVGQVFVSRGGMTLDDFVRFNRDYDFARSYQPADLETWTINPSLPANNSEPVDVPLSQSSLTPGLYYLNVSSPEVQNQSNDRRSLVVSNVNVTLKTSATEALVWAVNLRNGQPVADATVRVYDDNGERIATGQTDANGLWRGELTEMGNIDNKIAVVNQPGDDLFGLAMSDWAQGVNAYEFGYRYTTSGPQQQAYLYTERPVYRPGDTVHFRGVLRERYDGRYTLSGDSPIRVTLNDPSTLINEQSLQISPYGTFNGEFVLPGSAIPGGYVINLDLGNDKYIPGGSIYFEVADYRKPEINLAVELGPSPAKVGQVLTAKVNAAYFFGAPAADLPFDWQLYSRTSYFSIPEYQTGVITDRWLRFSDDGRFGSNYHNGKGRTDANGNFTIPLEDITVDTTSELTLEITATESGGFPVSARTTITLHPDAFYIGVRPEVWAGQAGNPLDFSLLTVDWTQNPVGGKPLTVQFKKVQWEREDSIYGQFNFTPIYTPLESRSVNTGSDGKASVEFTPPEAGTYVLEATSGAAKTQTLVWVSGGQNAVWPNLPYDQVRLTANKTEYKAGDTAEVFIPNPFNTLAQALITTERGTIKTAQVVSISSDGYRFSLPISDEQAPNIYVAATVLGPGASFRQGYINLPVEPSAFALHIDLKATPEKTKPGDTLTIDLTVSDSQGQPVQGEFSLSVVDLAALALAGPNSEEILPAYYDIQPLGVRTGLTDAVYTRRLLDFGGGGGGGGGGEILTIREKFPDTLFWKADILTDAQGKARITLTVPDSLTTWHVESRGLTKDTKVGQAYVRVVTTKDLLLRPQTPRFLVVGDKAELAALVNNNTAQALEATVSLQAPGFSLDDPAKAEQKVTVPANGRVRVAWSGLVQDGEAVDAVFAVKAGSLQDASRPTDGPIPVLRYVAPETFSTAGILMGAATKQEIIALPRTYQALGGNLDLELSPSLASAILSSLEALELPERPWSTEQILSYLLSNLATEAALKDAGLENPQLAERLNLQREDQLRRLVAAQNYDGGWPWVIGDQKNDPYLTAYILFGLDFAQNSGANTNLADAIQHGREYLFGNASIFTGGGFETRGAVNRAAFILYVAQKTGGLNNFAYLAESLYTDEYRAQLDPWAKILLALTLRDLYPTDERPQTLFSDVEATAVRSATGAHWQSAENAWMNPGSPLFTTAIVVYGLAETDPASPLVADAIRYLASQRNVTGWWGSSYETAWVILALDKIMVATGELQGDFGFSAALNGAPLAQGTASGPQNMTTVTATSPLTQLNLGGANSLLVSKQDGAGKLYYRATLNVHRPVETAPALNHGIALSREFLACKEKDCTPITAYQVKPDEHGRVTVRLTVTLPHDAYYLLVQDYIPAGSDILDSSLKTSQQGQESESVGIIYDESNPFGDGWGWWYFNQPQIYSDHILWSADYLPAGTYVLTYTIIPSLAGEYRVLPAHAWQAYFPEVQGTTAGAVFTIKP